VSMPIGLRGYLTSFSENVPSISRNSKRPETPTLGGCAMGSATATLAAPNAEKPAPSGRSGGDRIEFRCRGLGARYHVSSHSKG
jgi:hypothetical protein